MKFIIGTAILAAVATSFSAYTVDAFTTQPLMGRCSPSSMTTALASEAAATATEETKTPTIDRALIRKEIAGLTKDNFDATLQKIEPFLLTDAGATFHTKCMKRLQRNAKVLGATVPTTFAKEAKATEKRRMKQKAFIEAKELEAADAAGEVDTDAGAPEDDAAAAE
mmetsp:Transcript_3188/g.3601  ORF Transcript_3188/g.3601 Transcript_3188/m.3601 type:complete len:167 (+) Transcript_3188:138-638(+)|eukprot:CAMPEP_0170777732 /NCGR_PEP_ID=MMETSP0733-20121128/11959_1 /TAXON_ID=186038 /ORGANISM="Fragilariopsis kerguelensis, Strain L26-C5" /LENGTH=166 /DNA_ID=CAMNT_0011120997 /DNA_START=171 /DNA_END=671 /DNA_ORIENTATION=-